MLSLRSQSWDIAQYPEISNQSFCTILGGSRVAYTKYIKISSTVKVLRIAAISNLYDIVICDKNSISKGTIQVDIHACGIHLSIQ